MDTQNVTKTNDEVLDEDQLILREAETIILNSNKKHSRTKKVLFFVFPLLILIILLLLFSTIFALLNINNTNIISGVFIQGIDVSNLSVDEAKDKLNTVVYTTLSTNIVVKHGDFEASFSPSQFEVTFDTDEAVNTAYSIGRSSNIFANNYTILNALLSNINIAQGVEFNTELLDSIISQINDNLPDKVVNPDYYIDGNNLIITSGNDGVVVDTTAFRNMILSILNGQSDDFTIDIPVVNTAKNSIDIDEIYANIYKSAVDAYYTTNPYVVYPSSTGLDFNISIEDAKAMLETEQDEYIIPLKTLYPSVTTNEIGSEAFPDLLSSYSTSFASSNTNRATNIILASDKINNVVLMPGESFSFNQVVGQRTKEAGFKPATAYSNGEVVQEYGGGICQVSSTLYNAVLYANLQIDERTNHGYQPSYVPSGLDATVSWGGPDFKFSNNRNYPIRIVCDSSGRNLRIYIYGLKQDDDYTVKLDAQYLSTINYTTTYKTDSSLAPGESKVIQSGSNGCKTATYKYLYDSNGTLVSSECISRDTYNPHNKIVAVGK